MAEYGTIEYVQERIKELTTKKEILLNALENVAIKDFTNLNLIDKIAEEISSTNNSLKVREEERKKLCLEKLKGKS